MSGKEIIILFEETEIYLNPRLKEKLYNSLFNLSQKPGVKVLISTHDPHFIELGKSQKIYNVFRKDNGATKIDDIKVSDGYLDYTSHSEINYLIFGFLSPTYFLEVYERLLSYFKPKDICEGCEKPKVSAFNLLNEWLINNGATKDGEKNTRLSRIRHYIAHRNKKDKEEFSPQEEDMKDLIKFIELKQNELRKDEGTEKIDDQNEDKDKKE